MSVKTVKLINFQEFSIFCTLDFEVKQYKQLCKYTLQSELTGLRVVGWSAVQVDGKFDETDQQRSDDTDRQNEENSGHVADGEFLRARRGLFELVTFPRSPPSVDEKTADGSRPHLPAARKLSNVILNCLCHNFVLFNFSFNGFCTSRISVFILMSSG